MAVERAGMDGAPRALLSLWIIANGALAQIVMASRVVYGLRLRRGAPEWLARVSTRTGTPLRATLGATLTALGLALFVPLETLAAATSLVMLLVFAASNLALIRLERRRPRAPFDTPALVPWLGLVICLVLIVARFWIGCGH